MEGRLQRRRQRGVTGRHLQGDAIEIVSGAPWTTSMPKLPQEIVDHIVDRVYEACNGYALETDTQ